MMTHAPEELRSLYDYLEERSKKLSAKIKKIKEEKEELTKKQGEYQSEKEDVQNCMDVVINILLARRFINAEEANRKRKRSEG